jgi:PBSX family phage terminase large subunit
MIWTKTPTQVQAIKLLGSSARRILLSGGSRSGKTFIICYAIFVRALKEPGSLHAMGRLRFNHAVASLVHQTIPKMLRVCFPDLKVTLDRQNWYYELPNKSQIWIFGFDQKERIEKILGTEWSSIYLNECSMLEWNLVTLALTRLAAKTSLLNKLYLDQNPPSKSHWTYKVFVEHWNPENNEPLVDPENWVTMQMNPNDNLINLDEDYMSTLLSLPERARKRFLMGEYADDVVGALWSDSAIDKYREIEIPSDLIRVVVAIDPATTYGQDSDDTGIGACGKSATGHYYVLSDWTGKYSPNEWASKAVTLFYRWKGDKMVAESNQGGEMVRTTINNVDSDIRVKLVHAHRGKILRAEPVAGLYEQGKVHHVGRFVELEDQMTHYTGEPGQKSPNNLDWMVYAMLELMSKGGDDFDVEWD